MPTNEQGGPKTKKSTDLSDQRDFVG